MSDLDPLILANYLLPVLLVFTGVVAYVFGIRPILQQTPVFRDVYEAEAGWFLAISTKFSGVKQRLVTVGLSAASFIVLAHDEISPLVTQAGVDPSQFLPKVPTWAWPLITMAVLWLVQYFRNLADRQARANAEALLMAGHTLAAPAPGIPVTTLPSPSPLSALPDKVG
jgi:hypothetical protein